MGTERDHIANAGKMVVPDHIAGAGKLIDAPVEAGLAERLLARANNYDRGVATMLYPEDAELDRAAADRIQSQSAEIAHWKANFGTVNAQLCGYTERGLADVENGETKHQLLSRIATLETALTAAIEGQSYWQARAERFEAALLDISSATPDWLAEHGGAERLVDRALEALADAQQTPKPEEVRDA